jgi:hypothetical protein
MVSSKARQERDVDILVFQTVKLTMAELVLKVSIFRKSFILKNKATQEAFT